MGQGSGGRAEGGQGRDDLGDVGDVLVGRGASGEGEDGGSGELHFDWLLGCWL